VSGPENHKFHFWTRASDIFVAGFDGGNYVRHRESCDGVFMTPREVMHDETDAIARPFSLQELVLHGRPNRPASVFFLGIASLHAFLAFHAFTSDHASVSHVEGIVSGLLAICFILVGEMCLLARQQITIRPRQRQIHISRGVGRLAVARDIPFSAVRGVRVTLWQRRHQRSRLEILCEGDEIACPPTPIPRQQALYLALVMNVRLIKVSDDRTISPLANQREL
jgi:hypothetical protein